MQKQKSGITRIIAGIAAALALRYAVLLAFAWIASRQSDPPALTVLFTYAARFFADALTSLMLARIPGKDFARRTRVFLAVSGSLMLSILELCTGKTLFGGDINLPLLLLSVVAAAAGALILPGKKSRKRKNHRKSKR